MPTTALDVPATGVVETPLSGASVIQITQNPAVRFDVRDAGDAPTDPLVGLVLDRNDVSAMAIPDPGAGKALFVWSIAGEASQVQVLGA